MSVDRLMNQPVTVQPMVPGAADDYGNTPPSPSGSPVAETGFLDQTTTTEYLTDRDTAITKWKAFLHRDSVVTKLAVLTFGGQKFQVNGEPFHVYNPRTRQVSHIECELIEVS